MNRMGSLAGTDGRKKKEVRDIKYRKTEDIIEAVEWMRELVWQNVKNVIKRYLLKFRN